MAYNPQKHTGTRLTDADVTRIETNLDTLNTSIQAIPVVEPKTTVASEAQEIKGLTIDGTTYKIQSLTAEQLAAIAWAIEEKAKSETPIVTIEAPSDVLYNTAITLKWKCTANINKLEKLELYEGSTKLACNLDDIDNFDDFVQGTEYPITLESIKLITTNTSFRLKVNNGNFQGTKNVYVKYPSYYGYLTDINFSQVTGEIISENIATKFTNIQDANFGEVTVTIPANSYIYFITDNPIISATGDSGWPVPLVNKNIVINSCNYTIYTTDNYDEDEGAYFPSDPGTHNFIIEQN